MSVIPANAVAFTYKQPLCYETFAIFSLVATNKAPIQLTKLLIYPFISNQYTLYH
jgi:hypothetical protein